MELPLDADDWNWLSCWANSLRPHTVSRWVGSYESYTGDSETTNKEAFGLLFLLFASECARRDAVGSMLWRYIQKSVGGKVRFALSDHAIFSGGHPHSRVKEAVRSAAYRFGLRHHFGNGEDKQWFGTILLQCGFTRRGFQENGANWLAGHGHSLSVAALLDKQSPYYAATFGELWRVMQGYRKNNVPDKMCRDILPRCPWIIPEWIDDMLVAARRQETHGVADDDTEPDDSFLSPLRLCWDFANAPEWVTNPINLAQFDLPASRYDLFVGNRSVATLLRQADGTLIPLSSDVRLPLACITAPALNARLVGSDGVTVATQSLTIFDREEEIAVFDLSREGEPVGDPHNDCLSPNRRYAVIAAPDLVPQTPAVNALPLPGGFAKMHGFADGAVPTFDLEEEPFWEPVYVQRPVPAWLSSLVVTLHRHPANPGEMYLRVIPPRDGSVRRVAANREPLVHDPGEGQGFSYGPFVLPASPKVTATVVIEHGGQQRTVRRTLDLADAEGTFPGAGMRRTEQGWEWLDPKKPARMDGAVTEPIRWIVPKDWEILRRRGDEEVPTVPKWCLMEGDRWVGTVGGRGAKGRTPHPLPRSLGGFGLPLVVRPQAFNNAAQCAEMTRPQLTIASYLFDTGCVSDFALLRSDTGERRLSVLLRHPVEPDADHAIIWWDATGMLHSLAPEVPETGSSMWRVRLPGDLSEPVAVALTYKGRRIGGAWRDSWHDLAFGENSEPTEIAARLRFFKLPVCTADCRDAIQAYWKKTPGASVHFLTTWLAGETEAAGLPPNLSHNAENGWDAAVRCVFGDWKPTAKQARSVMNALTDATHSDIARVHFTAERLLTVSPLLAARTVNALLARQTQATAFRNRVFRSLLGIKRTSSDADIAARKDELVAVIARDLSCPDSFLNHRHAGLIPAVVRSEKTGGSLTETQQENYHAAVSRSEYFRRILSALLIVD